MAEFPRVFVSYVDDTKTVFPPERWPDARGDGVEEVYFEVSPGVGHRLSGHSLYWLYREGDAWVVGSGTVGEQPLTTEGVYRDDGTAEARPLGWMPDLPHCAVKLGWWRPGTEGRIEP